MSIQLPLAEIARLNSGRGPVRQQQAGAPYDAPNGPPSAVGDGVDVSAAHLALIMVRPVDGDVGFRVWVRWQGENVFDVVDGGARQDVDANWSQRLQIVAAAEVYIEITEMSAEEVDIIIAPCTG